MTGCKANSRLSQSAFPQGEDGLDDFLFTEKNSLASYGYNIQNGGSSNGKFTQETKDKISKAKKGKKLSFETRQKEEEGSKTEIIEAKNINSPNIYTGSCEKSIDNSEEYKHKYAQLVKLNRKNK